MLRDFFTKKPVPLTGAPTVRRLKTYSAQSGYVYQYFYEGQRPLPHKSEPGTEFVFTVTADRKTSHPLSVLVPENALHAWEQAHAHSSLPPSVMPFPRWLCSRPSTNAPPPNS